MSLHKRLIGQLVQILFGDGFDAGLTTQLFVMLKLDVIVFGIKNNKLIVPIDINNGNKVWDERILSLLHKQLTGRRSPRPLRFINQVNEFLMPDLLIRFSQPHRGRREFADLAGAALSVLEIPFARLEASGAEDLIFGIFPGILRM